MTGQWFRSVIANDPAWHRSAHGPIAVCGTLGTLFMPWEPAVPPGQITCADCEED
ncbi:hypothetical protein [Jiangella gansuensis]|uniref:hypothetical protein n=1 Tax=Jiangella gansuensis TaxID=281473 RepID=UPI0004B362E1|nr:hypothetical protein [Jiangella gansuensis]